MASIKALLKDRILGDVIREIKPPNRWKVLVADTLTLKILNSACKLDEILEENVTIVESLERRRQPFADLEAIYFITPTPESIDLVIADYTRGRPPYAAAHLFFTAGLPETLFQKVKNSPLQRYVKTLRELSVDFVAYEHHCFLLDLPLSLPAAINAPSMSLLNYEMENVARRLVSVLATLGDYPYIRYYNPSAPTAILASAATTSNSMSLSGKLANLVQVQLDNLCRMDSTFPPPSPYPRSVLVIVDRGYDSLSPLLHEYTYQCLLNDLLVVADGLKVTREDGSMAVLDDRDPVFKSQKYNHIANVMNYMAEGVKKFAAENKAANWEITGMMKEGNIAQVQGTLAAVPEYLEMKDKLSLHTSLVQKSLSLLNRFGHDTLARIEQELATGETAELKAAKGTAADVQAVLEDESICHADKIRLLLIYIISQEGLPDAERQRLFTLAKLGREEYQAMTNLSLLGVRLSATMEKKKSDASRSNPYSLTSLRTNRKRVKVEPFADSRYTPTARFILEDQLKNNLDGSVFPWVKEPPPMSADFSNGASTSASASSNLDSVGSIPRTKPSWATKKSAAVYSGAAYTNTLNKSPIDTPLPSSDVLRRNGPRIIFFVLGGVTFSELREAYEVMKDNQREVFLGSTHLITPHSFMDSLKYLHRTGFPPQSEHPYKERQEFVPPKAAEGQYPQPPISGPVGYLPRQPAPRDEDLSGSIQSISLSSGNVSSKDGGDSSSKKRLWFNKKKRV
ncbi:vacuolar sorting protein VPS33/slp1 [Chytridiales sp. JEL 0842]|nr:vacuolar sorting protein VPS33/slp1 [Chytridiales sp. JEL 0842]